MRRKVEDLLLGLLNLSLIFSLLSRIPFKGWLQEAHINFLAYYLVAHLVSLPLLLFLRRRMSRRRIAGTAILLIVLVLTPLRQVAPFYVPAPWERSEAPAGCKSLSILYANVLTENEHHDALSAIIAERDPDLVFLVEVNDDWLASLALRNRYAFAREMPRADNFGMALYSRYSIAEDLLTSVDIGPPFLLGEIEIPEFGSLAVGLIHAMPPATAVAFRTNRFLLRRIASQLKERWPDALVATDMNATPFSPFYQVFMQGAELMDAFWGRGLPITWNALLPLVRLNLDHVFVKGAIRPLDIEKLGSIGSDHFPIFGKFAFCPKRNAE